jgi:hypothetical protein
VSTLTPTPPVRFCIARLRPRWAETSRFSDAELLELVNDGYRSACEQSELLETLDIITTTAGVQSYPLPADWGRTIAVYQAGFPLVREPLRDLPSNLGGTFDDYDGNLTLGEAPAEAGSLYLLYSRVPALLGLDDTPEWGGEWDYLLRHYVAWQATIQSGGAQSIATALAERANFDAGVQALIHQKQSRKAVTRVRSSTQLTRIAVAGY